MTVETGTLVKSKLARDPLPDVTPQALSRLVDDNNDLAFDLYQHLRQQQAGNLFFSPYSLSAGLAMLYAGARGATEAQMAQTLHFALGQAELHPAFNALDLRLNSAESHWESGAEPGRAPWRAASGLWAQHDYPLLPAFLDVLGRSYGAGVRLVAFDAEAGRERARRAINAWARDETGRKITQLIAPGGLGALTRLVLANAVYFKGAWAEPFDDDSPPAPFYTLGGGQVATHLMIRHEQTPYARWPDCEAVSLAYGGNRLEIVLLLPPAEQFAEFEQSLTAGKLRRMVGGLQGSEVRLHLPRFTFDTSLSLAGSLAALGMPLAFDAERADFSGASARPGLCVSDVIHKAFVAVDEQGSAAAVATGDRAPGAAREQEPARPIVVRADHPFVFLIRDYPTGSILFMGRLLDPWIG